MRVHCSASLFCFSLEAVDSVLVEKLDLLCFPRPVHVDDALVARAAEMVGEIALGFFVGLAQLCERRDQRFGNKNAAIRAEVTARIG